ncbi:branched-chain amino acid transaminase [bacterium]|nr:branched-chain amino acid transaminase [bacterium]
MTKYAFHNGSIVPIADAHVSITCTTFHYGIGCFAGIRAFWSEKDEQLYIFRAYDHYKRLLNSAKFLMSDVGYSNAELIEITAELLRKEEWRQNVYIRPIIYKDDGVFRVQLHDSTDKLAIYSQPVGAYIKADGALKVGVSSWRRVDDNAIPARGKISGTYINSALAKTEAVKNGYDEALVLTDDGHVSEASAANFFMVRDGVLITPPITDNVLEGITRKSIIEWGRSDFGMEVVERSIDRSELYLADEAFFCGTGVGVAAIGQVDGRLVGDGKVGPTSEKMLALYQKVTTGQVEKYKQWLTPVYSK